MNCISNAPPNPDRAQPLDEVLSGVREALASLRYGTIVLTVHDGRIVQLDVTERKRLNDRASRC